MNRPCALLLAGVAVTATACSSGASGTPAADGGSPGAITVTVTETIPAGDTYLTWMTKNVDAVAASLGG
ncbi:hypothetical protein [uncultured Friedmanniella sp.]|uniref:hypothetical protein n=1 Tax=uncultured Friedmanniella sp. TaxID=335381 RepID=UPI0035C9D438